MISKGGKGGGLYMLGVCTTAHVCCSSCDDAGVMMCTLHHATPYTTTPYTTQLQQQDAQEFFTYLLDSLHNDLLRLRPSSKSNNDEKNDISSSRNDGTKNTAAAAGNKKESITDGTNPSSSSSAQTPKNTTTNTTNNNNSNEEEEEWLTMGRRQRSSTTRGSASLQGTDTVVSAIFGGGLQSTVRCEGQRPSETVQPCTVLHLDLAPPQVWGVACVVCVYELLCVLYDTLCYYMVYVCIPHPTYCVPPHIHRYIPLKMHCPFSLHVKL